MLREENRYRYLRRFFGETLLYDYDARGRLLRRLHEGELAGDGSRPFVEERRYVWKMDRLAAETAYGPPGTGIGGYGAIRWRKTYVPGPSGLDDAPQVVFGVYQPGPYSGTASTYTFITDEMDTNLGIVAEDEGGTASEPPVPVCYLYTPYGQAHTETGPELLRVRFDVEATTARNAGAGTVTQEVPELKEATPGALVLTWSSPIAPASLEAGLHVERLVAGEGWVAVPESELSIGTRPSANPLTDTSAELRVLRLAGWQEATSYRVRLTPALADRLGRPFGRSETLQWTVPVAPSEEDDVPPPQYEQRYPRRYESYEAAGATAGGRFPGGQSRLFQGLYTDPVTGISYARARWLDTRTGAWLSEDPLGGVDSVNLYAFVAWQPTMGIDPMGDRVRFVRVDNQDNIRALTEKEREYITSGLEEFIGAEFAIDERGELSIEEISPECSPTGMLFMKGMIEDPEQDHLVYVFDQGWPTLGFAPLSSSCPSHPIVLDIGDIAELKFKGRATSATGGVGPILVHELTHAALGLSDPPSERMALETGETVDFVNEIRSERGFPLRNPYVEEPEGSIQSFTYVDESGKRVGRATINSAELLGQGERYRNWCQQEIRRAKAEGRVSECKGSRILTEPR